MSCSKCRDAICDLDEVGDCYSVMNGDDQEVRIIVGAFQVGEFEYRSMIFEDGSQSTIGYEQMPCGHWAITQRSLAGTQ